MRYVGVPLREDFSLDADALLARDRARAPGAHLDRLSQQSDRQPLSARGDPARRCAPRPGLVAVDEAYYAFSGGASLLDEVGRHPNLVAGAHGLEAGPRGPAPGRGDRRRRSGSRELDKLRMPYNVNVLTAAAAELLLERREVFDAPDGRDRGRARAPRGGARRACRGVRALSVGGELRPGARARRAARLRGAAGSVVYWSARSTARIPCSPTA